MHEQEPGDNGFASFVRTNKRELIMLGGGVVGMLCLLGWKWYDDYSYSQVEEAAGRPPTISYEGALASVREYERKVLEEARVCHSVVPNCPAEAYDVVDRRQVNDRPRTWMDDARMFLAIIPGSMALMGMMLIMQRNTIERRKVDPSYQPPMIIG